METEKIMRVLCFFGAVLLLIQAIFLLIFDMLIGVFSRDSGIAFIWLCFAFIILFMSVKPNDPIPFNGIVILIVGIVIIVLGILLYLAVIVIIGGIVLIVAGIIGLIKKES